MRFDKQHYERLRPLIVWLGLTELAWIAFWLLRFGDVAPGYLATVVVWIATMLGWLVFVIVAGTRGFFLKHTRWLSNLIGVALVIAVAAFLFRASQVTREGVLHAASGTSDFELVSIHTLRLLAIGTIVKYRHGELPLHFVVLGSIPDFTFAVSAVVVAVMTLNGPVASGFLTAWHCIGMFLFMGAGVSMFLSVPSRLRIYHSEPDSSIVFQFPMLLAPNYTVPLFMLAHAFALVKLVG